MPGVKNKLKKAADYVNDNLNPLTSKKNKAKAADYMKKAKSQTLAGKATNADTRMSRMAKGKK